MSEAADLFTEITNDARDYDWGAVDGISSVLGRPPTGSREAELWLGAHPSGPSRAVTAAGWGDLAEWEESSGERLPYLLKVLCAASPLSIQAHPTPEQAVAGFEREDAQGIPRDARQRNYKDRFAKPELIVALADGFEALCGFGPIDETLALLERFSEEGVDDSLLAPWRERLGGGGGDARRALTWVLSGAPAVAGLIAAIVNVADRNPREFDLVARLGATYPGDPGILVALMMNHVTLAAGEAIWLPAGNVHAYLRGDGVELMGPSDNVLRGGLTSKHVDTAELETVLDFSTGAASLLTPVEVGAGAVSYRPRSTDSGRNVPFELLATTGDAVLPLPGASIAVVTDGHFVLDSETTRFDAPRGTAVFVARAATVTVSGRGRLFCATAIPADGA